MRALQFRAYGGPEVVEWTEAAEPHADPAQLRIAVRAASVNPVDWKTISGALSRGQPMVGTGYLGNDAAGVVDEVAEGVTGVSVGDEVFGRGRNTQAEYAVLDAWAAKPASIDWGRWRQRRVWPVRRVSVVFGCWTSRPVTPCSSMVARVGWERSPCRWRSPEARR
jgi:NADPH:quinone reductase-like Zn-dependent oxidoreductase